VAGPCRAQESARGNLAVAPTQESAPPLEAPTRHWRVGVNIGHSFLVRTVRGRGELPATAPLVDVPLAIPQRTRFVSSWFFGSGAALIGDVNHAQLLQPGSVMSLDPVLDHPSIGSAGQSLQVRLSRSTSSSATLEFNVEWNPSGVEFQQDSRDIIEQSRASFAQWFGDLGQGLNGAGPTASAAVIAPRAASQETATVGVRWPIFTALHASFDVTVGGGAALNNRPHSTFTPNGAYDFTTLTNRRYQQTDVVSILLSTPRVVPVVTTGIGVRRALWGGVDLTVEVALTATYLPAHVFVTAHNSNVTISDPTFSHSGTLSVIGVPITLPYSGDPVTSIIFNDNAEIYAAFPPSLSGPAVIHAQTFDGHGWQLTAGPWIGVSRRL